MCLNSSSKPRISRFCKLTSVQQELKPETEHTKKWLWGNISSDHEEQTQHPTLRRCSHPSQQARLLRHDSTRQKFGRRSTWVVMILWMLMRAVHAPQGSAKSNAWPCRSSIIHRASGWEWVQTQRGCCSLPGRRRARPSSGLHPDPVRLPAVHTAQH